MSEIVKEKPVQKLKVKTAPYQRSCQNTQRIMLDVIIALLPTLIFGCVVFGFYALLLVSICVITCVMSEWIYQLCRKQSITKDLSCIVTGIILGLNLPSNCEWYLAIIGSVFAIIIVKMFFGGIGKNFANPAATARVFLMLAYASIFNKYANSSVDLVTNATFLTVGADALNHNFLGITGYWADVLQSFFGFTGGCIGETCSLAIILGGVYLIVRKVIDWRLPLITLLSASVFTIILYGDASLIPLELFSGGLMFGAMFMATDYSTSPKTKTNRIFFAIGIGFLTMAIRKYSDFSDGVCIAILVMNLFVPVLDRYIRPVRMGELTKKEKYKFDYAKLTAYGLCFAMVLTLLICIPLDLGGVL